MCSSFVVLCRVGFFCSCRVGMYASAPVYGVYGVYECSNVGCSMCHVTRMKALNHTHERVIYATGR